MTMEIKYGKAFTRDFDALPDTSRKAIATFGIAHYLGNVQASALVAKIRSHIAGKDGKASEVSTDAVKAWRKDESNASQLKAWQDELFADAVKDIDSGEIGVREGGPRLDPIEREFRTLVLARATSICEGIGVKMPGAAKDGEAAPTITLPGDNTVLTRVDLLRRVSESPKHSAELRKQAEQTVRARDRLTAKAKADASSNATAEALF